MEKVENESNVRIKCLRFDRGGEFTSTYINVFCEDNGIHRKNLVHKTPQQNGIVERRNITVKEEARTMFLNGKVSHVH